MIVVGAKGLAKEVIQIIEERDYEKKIYLYDDVNLTEPDVLYDIYPILRKTSQIKELFQIDSRFILGLGNPKLRKMLYKKFSNFGGNSVGLISRDVYKGKYTNIGDDAILMSGVKVSNGVKLGKALLAYYNVIITHDVEIGDFVELSPGCKLLGHVHIDDEVHIGAGAVILPKLTIGKGSIVGAGAVVTNDVPDDCIAVGVPAKITKRQ